MYGAEGRGECVVIGLRQDPATTATSAITSTQQRALYPLCLPTRRPGRAALCRLLPLTSSPVRARTPADSMLVTQQAPPRFSFKPPLPLRHRTVMIEHKQPAWGGANVRNLCVVDGGAALHLLGVLCVGRTRAAARAGHLPKSQRPCRNIEIYGYCKYAGKGCEYNHDSVCVACPAQYHRKFTVPAWRTFLFYNNNNNF